MDIVRDVVLIVIGIICLVTIILDMRDDYKDDLND